MALLGNFTINHYSVRVARRTIIGTMNPTIGNGFLPTFPH